MIPEPGCDIAKCTAHDCDWKGSIDDCPIGQYGDYETGYYDILLCPECLERDGSESEVEPGMSKSRCAEWRAWYESNRR